MKEIFVFIFGAVFLGAGVWLLLYAGPLWRWALGRPELASNVTTRRDRAVLRAKWTGFGCLAALFGGVLLAIAPRLG